jgi:hypothetical protein
VANAFWQTSGQSGCSYDEILFGMLYVLRILIPPFAPVYVSSMMFMSTFFPLI